MEPLVQTSSFGIKINDREEAQPRPKLYVYIYHLCLLLLKFNNILLLVDSVTLTKGSRL